MQLNEYTDPADRYAPRPDASQQVAAAHRQRPTADDSLSIAPRRQLLGIFATLIVAALIMMITWQLTATTPRALQLPTVQPTTPATVAPAALSVLTALPSTPVLPTATLVAPEPSQEAGAPQGQGMTWVEPAAAPAAPPSYIEVVGQQAPHSPRGNPAPALLGGDHVLVPTLTSQQLVIVGSQAPHKVR